MSKMNKLNKIYNDVLDLNVLLNHNITDACKLRFRDYITEGIKKDLFIRTIQNNDLFELAQHIDSTCDNLIPQEMLEFLYDHVLLRYDNTIIETPQYLWMRLALSIYTGNISKILSTYKYISNTLDLSEFPNDFLDLGLTTPNIKNHNNSIYLKKLTLTV